MSNKNIKAPYDCMELKEYKLSDFIPEFFLNSVNMMIFLDLVVKIHKMRFDLKNQHNIEISHQSIENILLKLKLSI